MADEIIDSGAGAAASADPGAAAPEAAPATPAYLTADAFTQYQQAQDQRWNELGSYFQRLEARLTPRTQEPQPQPGQQFNDKEREVADLIWGLLQRDQRWNPVFRSAQASGQMAQTLYGLTQEQQAAQQAAQSATLNAGYSRLTALAKDAGYPHQDDSFMTWLARSIAGLGTPQQQARFRAGDLTVVDETFDTFQNGAKVLRQQGLQALQGAKQRTMGLPPAPARGGQPAGAPQRPRLDPNASPEEIQRYQQGTADRAAEMLARLAGGG